MKLKNEKEKKIFNKFFIKKFIYLLIFKLHV